MRDNKVNPWRRCSWMQHRLPSELVLFLWTSHIQVIDEQFFYPIKWQHAWNIDTMRKEKRPRDMVESFHNSLQFSTAQNNTTMKSHYTEVKETSLMDQPSLHIPHEVTLSSPGYSPVFHSVLHPSVNIGNKNHVINFSRSKRFMRVFMGQGCVTHNWKLKVGWQVSFTLRSLYLHG
jgi:hypothetical protein